MKTENRFYGLDHLRALAILLVIVFHYGILFPHPGWIKSIGSFGWAGVDLFFVLSGYLIASQLFKSEKKISLKEFYTKRFFRIIPAYLMILTIYFCFPGFRERESLSPLWKFLTFTQNFGLDLRYFRTFSHAWSLCIEEQFYLLFPLIILLLGFFKPGKKASILLIALFLLGFLFRIISWNKFVEPFMDTDEFGSRWSKWIYYPTYNRLDGLLAGVSVAAIFNYLPVMRDFLIKYSTIVFVSGLALITTAYFLCLELATFHASVFGFPLVAIAFGLIVIAALSPSCFLYRFSSKITSAIAALSYSAYLVHKGVIHITQEQFAKLNIETDSTLMFFICLSTTFLAATILYYVVEKPFLRLRKYVLERK